MLVIEERPTERAARTMADYPIHDVGPWPENLSLRREDMDGDDGR